MAQSKPPEADSVIQQIYSLPFQGTYTKTCGFQYYSECNSSRPGFHYGTDYALGSTPLSPDHPVAAAAKGIVKMCPNNGTAGNTLVINHGNGHITRYLHMNNFAVFDNQTVGRGQVIGFEGDTGDSDGIHLHFETSHDASTFTCGLNGTRVDPYAGQHSPGTYLWKTNPPSMARDMDWSGDGYSDVLTRQPNGDLCMFAGNGSNGWIAYPDTPCLDGLRIGTGWGVFNWIFRPGDFSGDGCHDILARENNGVLKLYKGNCATGFSGGPITIGSGWEVFNWFIGPGDFSGDGYSDILARKPDGELCLFEGNGQGGVIPYPGPPCLDGKSVTGGWHTYDRIVSASDFGAGGCMDVIGKRSTGNGLADLFKGNCAGGWSGSQMGMGSGWNEYEQLIGTGDFSGDGCPDVLARKYVGFTDLYNFRGNCVGGWNTTAGIGSGWWAFNWLF